MANMTMSQLASKFIGASKQVTPLMERKLDTIAQAGVGTMKRSIQGFRAVDTGAMLNSVESEKTGPRDRLIGPTVKYAPYVALGTSRMPARPFHITATKKMESIIPAVMAMTAKELGL